MNKITHNKKMEILKSVLKKHTGKGGLISTSFKEANSPINLLKHSGPPPTASSVPKSKENR